MERELILQGLSNDCDWLGCVIKSPQSSLRASQPRSEDTHILILFEFFFYELLLFILADQHAHNACARAREGCVVRRRRTRAAAALAAEVTPAKTKTVGVSEHLDLKMTASCRRGTSNACQCVEAAIGVILLVGRAGARWIHPIPVMRSGYGYSSSEKSFKGDLGLYSHSDNMILSVVKCV